MGRRPTPSPHRPREPTGYEGELMRCIGRVRSRVDEGFSLIEVIVAMVIIAAVMATLAGIVVSSLTTITQARQRQTATALATQAIERLRALPYDTISLANASATPDATATYAVLDGGLYYLRTALPNLALEERLIVNGVSGRASDQTVDEVTYRVHSYVSLAPLTAGGQQAFNLTAIVVYTSTVSRGERITAQRSVAFSPSRCLSTASTPQAGRSSSWDWRATPRPCWSSRPRAGTPVRSPPVPVKWPAPR